MSDIEKAFLYFYERDHGFREAVDAMFRTIAELATRLEGTK